MSEAPAAVEDKKPPVDLPEVPVLQVSLDLAICELAGFGGCWPRLLCDGSTTYTAVVLPDAEGILNIDESAGLTVDQDLDAAPLCARCGWGTYPIPAATATTAATLRIPRISLPSRAQPADWPRGSYSSSVWASSSLM
jgi:hypothetical protein